MLSWIKKIPLTYWILIGVGILFLINLISGWSYSNRLWKMVKNEIVSDEKKIIQNLERQREIDQQDKESLRRDLGRITKERDKLKVENERLSRKAQEIKDALENVRVPDNANELVDLIHKLGLKSVRKR